MNKKKNVLSNIQESYNQEQKEQQIGQKILKDTKKQYSYLKIVLSVILVFLSTYSADIQIQYHGPFIRTIQCFFNYHLIQHQSQDIYQAPDVIFYRTQEYVIGEDIIGFFDNYIETLDTFYQDSFFYFNYTQNHNLQFNHYENGQKQTNVTIMIFYQFNQESYDKNKRKNQYFQSLSLNQHQKIYKNIQSNNKSIFVFIQSPISQLQQLFNQTVRTKQFYQYIKKMQLITHSFINYRQQKVKLQIKVISNFESSLRMQVKVQSNVIQLQTQEKLKNNQKNNFDQDNLGIRKLPQHHFLNTKFQGITWLIFIVNAGLFCLELMVIIRVNAKIQQNLYPQQTNGIMINSSVTSQFSIYSDQDPQTPIKRLTYRQKIDIIGRYSIIQILISFLIMFSFQQKGLVCLFCWTKISVILSSTGNKLMIGFLFKNALPTLFKIIINLMLPLMGFVFFSMIVYSSIKKFQSLQLAFYQYIFNYFQYGIYQNFIPIQKYGPFYSFTYFLQLFFLVSIGNNILQSILAQQVLKNSNLKSLTEFIENIQIQCPICGCPPEIKKKIKIKMKKQNDRQNRFISKYFNKSQRQTNKSKYQIKIASPQFSPMFHKSQLKKKQYHFKKRELLPQRKNSEDQPVKSSPPFSPQSMKKKVKFQIGSELKINEKYSSKSEKLIKEIIAKSQVLNRVFNEFNTIISSSNSVNKYLYEQILKKKLEDLKKLQSLIN